MEHHASGMQHRDFGCTRRSQKASPPEVLKVGRPREHGQAHNHMSSLTTAPPHDPLHRERHRTHPSTPDRQNRDPEPHKPPRTYIPRTPPPLPRTHPPMQTRRPPRAHPARHKTSRATPLPHHPRHRESHCTHLSTPDQPNRDPEPHTPPRTRIPCTPPPSPRAHPHMHSGRPRKLQPAQHKTTPTTAPPHHSQHRESHRTHPGPPDQL